MVSESSFNFLGENLFATGINRDRIASVKFQNPVGGNSGSISGDGVADAVDCWERALSLFCITEIAERDAPALGQPTEIFVSWFKATVEFGRDDGHASAWLERSGRDLGTCPNDLACLLTRFR